MLPVQIVMVLMLLFPHKAPEKAYLVVRGERITVQASTSMGDIHCTYSNQRQGDTLYLNRQAGKRERLVLNLPVANFSCGNILLTRDFQRTLKAKKYPLVRVEVLELVQEGQRLEGCLRLQLAGKTQVLRGVAFYRQQAHTLSTSLCLNFSDFELATPNKLGGLVKVDEELQVTVDLQLVQTL